MRFVPDASSVVVAGFWNPRLFAVPLLIGNGFARSPQIGVRFALEDPLKAPQFEFDDLLFSASLARLQINFLNGAVPTLKRAQHVASLAAQKYGQTPLQGVGINLRFVEKEPHPEILGIFNLQDNPHLTDLSYKIESTALRRKLAAGERVLNLSLELGSDASVAFDFNFHRSVTNCNEVTPELTRFGTLDAMREALACLKASYNCDVAELETAYVNDGDHTPVNN